MFSPYKDVGINLNWETFVLGTGTPRRPLLLALESTNVTSVVWSFATGVCGSETWAGVQGETIAAANVNASDAAGIQYTISTGGAAGSFLCTNDDDFEVFVRRYLTPSLIGIDFDIEEVGTTADNIDYLVQRVKHAQSVFPGLRWSFTLATLGGYRSPSLGDIGVQVMASIAKNDLSGYIINLMAMDYGKATRDNCILDIDGECQMGLSAIQSAINLHEQFHVPYDQIEVTPMIGGNDVPRETFTISDAQLLSEFAVNVGLAGIHQWSFDRDIDAPSGSHISPTSNSYGNGGEFGFMRTFTAALGIAPTATSDQTLATLTTRLSALTTAALSQISSASVNVVAPATTVTDDLPQAILPVAAASCDDFAKPWEQCGGRDWTGAAICQPGFVCHYVSEWYSNCIPE